MPYTYTTSSHLRPVELWRLRLATGDGACATLSPPGTYVGVVWYLDDQLQDAAQFQDREAAIKWAEDVRQMLTARTSA